MRIKILIIILLLVYGINLSAQQLNRSAIAYKSILKETAPASDKTLDYQIAAPLFRIAC